MLGMLRVAVEVMQATVFLAVLAPFLFLPPILGSHFKKGCLPSSARRTSKQSLQVALGDRIGRVVKRELSRVQMLVESVEPWGAVSWAPWGHSNVRHNFGYRGPLPLFSGICWHLLKRKRRGRRGAGSQQVQSSDSENEVLHRGPF